MKRSTLTLLAGAALFAATAATDAVSAEYPTKPVELMVSFSAGGSTDVLMRIFSKHAEKYLGQPIVVVNKPGAGGVIAWTILAHAKADGYLLSNINLPSLVTKPIAQPKEIQYKPEDFKPLANFVTDPGVIAVRADGDIKSLKELLDRASKDPKGTTISHEGVGGDDHLALLEVQRATGVEFNMVAFDGNAPATAALLGGHIIAFEGNMSEVIQQIQDGKVRALAIWAETRNPALPDIPTGKELGVDVVSGSSRGLAGPAGMPNNVQAKWEDVVAKTAADPEFVKALKDLNMPMEVVAGDKYDQMIQRSTANYRKLWEAKPWIEK